MANDWKCPEIFCFFRTTSWNRQIVRFQSPNLSNLNFRALIINFLNIFRHLVFKINFEISKPLFKKKLGLKVENLKIWARMVFWGEIFDVLHVYLTAYISFWYLNINKINSPLKLLTHMAQNVPTLVTFCRMY